MTHLSLDQLIAQVDAASPGEDPVRQLSLAVLGSEELNRTADDLVGHYVERARAAGTSWADIGAAMGVTKQAAQQADRHRGGRSHDVDELDGLDPGARAALERAREEARGLRHHYVGTEHVLLGVLRLDDDLATRLGVTPDDATETALALVGRGEVEVARPPLLTARARKTVDLAAAEATALGHDLVTSTDLLRGILREGRGIGARVLDQRGGGLARVREVLAGI
ncbi:hypothetical protein FE634_21950 [Nocardioides dongxiaopingii]|uniref:Clp protease N-terminal domain-containing protein n=1 Tax=Nocardioides TaxID=1839 RepID=UPI0010C76406|nr:MULTISPECIES: Clp protease N-terminal domain-containing protein [Nocardioides]QDH11064.1 hypothetical protein FE634_21950 [Nocardioides sp. S-1144]